jgi:hypothetical protein
LRTIARAIDRRWRWPPESVMPFSPTRASYPEALSRMKSSALASRAAV